ncbi:tRNA (uridine(54)-C5)-methyltransferase TrmA [Pseudidiomarina andamanensis]|uniref:tRNA/tmRNA (uracil-C(5))-methyltransferase n=1 Tax=Pseudidiomarina andamanensis TaxID=1940690 RepID=A0AA92EW90_9GAMM|nr:tRNA (uridine(54)-C5)-methyltransferase TrmA [Pseudidiomarina andamanensis]MDS0219162.1 tRNA (uridine(54)-C5)-methyltransferase TrmA [Pseudidiomarina andamanensis]QGT95904.1 tRNA (uridine(54)-C5)-methyltransferase TrmA [Pseudidiomarina andamanensis]
MTHLAIDSDNYQAQLSEKEQLLKSMLAPFSVSNIDVYASPTTHYRMRAEFRVWHDGDDLFYIMFNPETREKIRVDVFPVANQLINELMPAILDYVRERPTLRQKLFQVEFLTTTTNEALISLIYHRQLDESWQHEARELKKNLSKFGKIEIVGRAKKQKICLDQDWVLETLVIDDKPYRFQQVENSFTQPNAAVNQHMVSWALNATKDSEGDLLELYCGNGNFSLPLAQNFNRVLATEISKTSVNSARYNCEVNNINNVTIVRMSAEDFSAVMAGEKESRRANEAELEQFDCRTVLVDPPRAGLDADTVELVRNYDSIVYISCNPETLVENLKSLQSSHEVSRAAFFDQFPYTHHMEAGVLLKKKR